MSEALKNAVEQLHASRAKTFGDGATKLSEFTAFLKKRDQLNKAKNENDFKKIKKACDAQLKAAIKAGIDQAKSTPDWDAKIKEAKKQLDEELKKHFKFKEEWLKKLDAARVHNAIVDQLNKPGPDTEKLKHKLPDSVLESIIQNESELLNMQKDIKEDEGLVPAYKEQQKRDTETLEQAQKALADKEFQAKGKKP